LEQPIEEGALEWVDEIPVPQAVVDGGGEEWAVLGEVIRRRLGQMERGEILEIVSEERRNRTDIPAWCYLTGHDLLHMFTDGDSTRFWIRKGHTAWRE
jgi:TusA-related sulfurtransferase